MDLVFLTPDEKIVAAEVKATLTASRMPPLSRRELTQMSAAWVDKADNPGMADLGLHMGGRACCCHRAGLDGRAGQAAQPDRPGRGAAVRSVPAAGRADPRRGGRRMFVVGWTSGGATYGVFEDEMDAGMDGLDAGECDQPY